MSVIETRLRYDEDAAAYEQLWAPVLHRGMQPLLEQLSFDRVKVAVEIGCGTGGVMADLRRLAPSARLVGVDISGGMLARNAHRSRVVQADVQALPIATAAVDLVVCGFMLQHVPAPPEVFASAARVLRNDGVFAVASWVAPRGGPFLLANQVVTEELDRAGASDEPNSRPGGAYTDSPEKLSALATAAGLRVDGISRQSLQWEPTAGELVAQLTSMRTTGRRFARLDARSAAQVRAASLARLEAMALPDASSHWVCYVLARKTD